MSAMSGVLLYRRGSLSSRLVSRRCHDTPSLSRLVPGPSQNRTWCVTPFGFQSEASTSALDRGGEQRAVSAATVGARPPRYHGVIDQFQ